MSQSVLHDVVHLGGLALQSEDCAIRAAVHHRQESGGLARMNNERHRQFIVWRALLPIYHAEMERHENTDLVIHGTDGEHYFEMKNWISPSGERELPSIRRDVGRLAKRQHGYILITSINPYGHMDENFTFLLEKVDGLDLSSMEKFRFETVDYDNNKLEAWIAGWRLTADTGQSV